MILLDISGRQSRTWVNFLPLVVQNCGKVGLLARHRKSRRRELTTLEQIRQHHIGPLLVAVIVVNFYRRRI